MKIPVFSFLLSLILSVLAAISPLEAQENLVPNGDFEEYTLCPSGSELINFAKEWFDANEGSCDYFNACADITSGVDIPNNYCGTQSAFSGNGYAGFCPIAKINSYYNYSYYEYLTTKLNSKLEENENYCIQFRVSYGDTFSYKANHFQILISNDSIFPTANDGSFSLYRKSQLIVPTEDINDKEWKEISLNYLALGGEQYISFGLFDTLFTFNSIRNSLDSNYGYTDYYFIDAVSVSKNIGQCPITEPMIPNVFTPNKDKINDFFVVDADLRMQIMNRWGQVLFEGDSRAGWDGKWNDKEMATGVYFYILTDGKDYNTKTGYFHLWR